jgi:Dolichyl-phosphate-mannose-protein mannosyltransferase
MCFRAECRSLYAFSSMRQDLVRAATSRWVITLVAFLLRVAYFLYMSQLIPRMVLADVPFQNEVGNVASALAQGQGFCCLFRQATGPTAWLAPIYPVLVAGVFKVFGTFTLRSFATAVLLNCVFSATATIPLFLAGKRVGGLAAAAVAGWIWAAFPSGIILPFEWIWDTSLSVLLAATLLWATLALEKSSKRRDFALYGVLWAVSLLTNPALGAVLPFLIAWLIYRQRASLRQVVASSGLTVALIILCCLPWTARNYFYFHRFIPLRSNFPYEFWSGNNEIFDEHSRTLNRITRYEQIHLYAQLGENAFLDQKKEEAVRFVRTHPALYAQLFCGRIVATWLGTNSPWQDFADTDSPLARFLIGWNAVVLVAMLVGLGRLYLLKGGYFIPVAAFPLMFPLPFYIAHTSLRHRHPCDPIVALLIAVAIAGTQRENRENDVESGNS